MCKIFKVQLKVGVTSSGGGFCFPVRKRQLKDYHSKALILLSFPPAWVRTNSTDFKDLVAVREECG